MAGDVGEVEVGWADELDGWTFEHRVVLFADKPGVFDRFMDDVMDVLRKEDVRMPDEISTKPITDRSCADYAHIVGVWLEVV